MVCTVEELNKIIARLRKVKYGDLVLSADHNDLVDAVRCLRDLVVEVPVLPPGFFMELEKFIPAKTYSVIGEGTTNNIVVEHIKSENLGTLNKAGFFGIITAAFLGSAPWDQCIELCLLIRDKTKKPTVSPGDIAYMNIGLYVSVYNTFMGHTWDYYFDFYPGDLDDYGNTINAGDEICFDVVIARYDRTAGSFTLEANAYGFFVKTFVY